MLKIDATCNKSHHAFDAYIHLGPVSIKRLSRYDDSHVKDHYRLILNMRIAILVGRNLYIEMAYWLDCSTDCKTSNTFKIHTLDA